MTAFRLLTLFIAFLIPLCADSSNGNGNGNGNGNSSASGNFKASLTGYDEVLPVWTTAAGNITVQVDTSTAKITVAIEYSNLTATPTAVRLHWGPPTVNGPAIMAVCGAPSSNVCPANGATATTFTFTAQALVKVDPQTNLTGSFPAANLNAFVDALNEGVVYANVYTQQLPNGEIRGQLGRGNGPTNPRRGGPKP
jgi:hypothetical protein